MAVTGIHRVHLVRYLPPDIGSLGHIDIIEAKFDKDWWCEAVIEAVKLHSHLTKIRLGFLPVPLAGRPRKKSPRSVKQPAKRQKCRLFLHNTSSE